MTAGLVAELRVERGGFALDAGVRIEPGCTAALLGPNGAGKSTVVAALAGLLPIDRGCIELNRTVLDDPRSGVFVEPPDRHIGVVFQDYLLFPHLNVVENVAFGLRSRGEGRATARRRAQEWLERLDMAALARQSPAELSGGQAQRVALARALITDPALLLLDEPLAALDATTRVELRRTLTEHLDAFAGPRLIITHDPTEAFALADQIFVLEEGHITQQGRADDIRLRPRTRYAADLAGVNLIRGVAAQGRVDTGGHLLHIADTRIVGPVLATVHPHAISLHRDRPEGSPRNTWQTTIDHLERLGDRVRVQTGPPLSVTAEVTPQAVEALELRTGSTVWLSIKATEIGVESR